MKEIEELMTTGRVSSVAMGISAVPYKGVFCGCRPTGDDALRVQGYGLTLAEAFADMVSKLPPVTPINILKQLGF